MKYKVVGFNFLCAVLFTLRGVYAGAVLSPVQLISSLTNDPKTPSEVKTALQGKNESTVDQALADALFKNRNMGSGQVMLWMKSLLTYVNGELTKKRALAVGVDAAKLAALQGVPGGTGQLVRLQDGSIVLAPADVDQRFQEEIENLQNSVRQFAMSYLYDVEVTAESSAFLAQLPTMIQQGRAPLAGKPITYAMLQPLFEQAQAVVKQKIDTWTVQASLRSAARYFQQLDTIQRDVTEWKNFVLNNLFDAAKKTVFVQACDAFMAFLKEPAAYVKQVNGVAGAGSIAVSFDGKVYSVASFDDGKRLAVWMDSCPNKLSQLRALFEKTKQEGGLKTTLAVAGAAGATSAVSAATTSAVASTVAVPAATIAAHAVTPTPGSTAVPAAVTTAVAVTSAPALPTADEIITKLKKLFTDKAADIDANGFVETITPELVGTIWIVLKDEWSKPAPPMGAVPFCAAAVKKKKMGLGSYVAALDAPDIKAALGALLKKAGTTAPAPSNSAAAATAPTATATSGASSGAAAGTAATTPPAVTPTSPTAKIEAIVDILEAAGCLKPKSDGRVKLLTLAVLDAKLVEKGLGPIPADWKVAGMNGLQVSLEMNIPAMKKDAIDPKTLKELLGGKFKEEVAASAPPPSLPAASEAGTSSGGAQALIPNPTVKSALDGEFDPEVVLAAAKLASLLEKYLVENEEKKKVLPIAAKLKTVVPDAELLQVHPKVAEHWKKTKAADRSEFNATAIGGWFNSNDADPLVRMLTDKDIVVPNLGLILGKPNGGKLQKNYKESGLPPGAKITGAMAGWLITDDNIAAVKEFLGSSWQVDALPVDATEVNRLKALVTKGGGTPAAGAAPTATTASAAVSLPATMDAKTAQNAGILFTQFKRKDSVYGKIFMEAVMAAAQAATAVDLFAGVIRIAGEKTTAIVESEGREAVKNELLAFIGIVKNFYTIVAAEGAFNQQAYLAFPPEKIRDLDRFVDSLLKSGKNQPIPFLQVCDAITTCFDLPSAFPDVKSRLERMTEVMKYYEGPIFKLFLNRLFSVMRFALGDIGSGARFFAVLPSIKLKMDKDKIIEVFKLMGGSFAPPPPLEDSLEAIGQGLAELVTKYNAFKAYVEGAGRTTALASSSFYTAYKTVLTSEQLDSLDMLWKALLAKERQFTTLLTGKPMESSSPDKIKAMDEALRELEIEFGAKARAFKK